MTAKEDNFIFKRDHRRLTFASILLLLPLFLTYLTAILVWLSDVNIAQQALETIIMLPTWVQAVIWIILPLWSIYLSRKGYQRGTLHNLRSWNKFILRLTLVLVIGEVLVVVAQLVL